MASFCILPILILFVSIPPSLSQSQPQPDSCNGIFLSYVYNSGRRLPPAFPPSDPTQQPYRFESTLTVLNNGLDELESWRVFLGFQHGELLVSASNAILADGTSLPANVTNGTVLAGFPVTDLRSAVQTAGDINQMQAQVMMVGTVFGIGPPNVPMPSTLYLANDGFACSRPATQGNRTTVCCTRDSNARSNVTLDNVFPPRGTGDLTITYDVIRSYEVSYWAQVTIANHNPLGRLDNWHLSWDWTNDEFIHAMRGAYPYVVDTTQCLFGRQGQQYPNMDFSNALNCQRTPTIIDLPLSRTNDTNLGMIPFCCRNGTILSPFMDPSRSRSVFQMEVYKMPPNLNRTDLTPPQNWKINGSFNPDYECSPPVRVAPSLFPDPSGLPSNTAAVASWQVVCNITRTKPESPKCCVSFSAFFNDSVIPCNTCACGCNANTTNNVCSATAPALLLPSEVLPVPFENRTSRTLYFAELNRRAVPDPLPCGDNCGVSIHWHLDSDYRGGWTVRMTVFNWGQTDFADWFAAVQLDKAGPGFERVYSFNGSSLPGVNNTIFMQGLPDFNYLVAERDGRNPRRDPRLPGMAQSELSFRKRMTPGINVVLGDGFPTKVLFNGEECSLPTMLPSIGHLTGAASLVFSVLIALLPLMFLLQC